MDLLDTCNPIEGETSDGVADDARTIFSTASEGLATEWAVSSV